jgi:hypothetical protein
MIPAPGFILAKLPSGGVVGTTASGADSPPARPTKGAPS